MLKLNLKTEPYWLDLPGNVRIKVKPVSTAIMSAAQAMAMEAYKTASDSGELENQREGMKRGISESLLVKALAKLAITEWEGVLEANAEKLAEVNERNITDLMDIWLVAQDFFKAYVTQITLLESEGNGLALAANGISAAAAPIATSAESTISPAPTAV